MFGTFNIPANETPEQLAKRRQMLASLMQGTDQIRYTGQGIADGLSKAFAGWNIGRLDKAEGARRSQESEGFRRDVLNYTPPPQGPMTVLGMDPAWGGQSFAEPGSVEQAPFTITPGTGAGSNFPQSLIKSESGGNWQALNDEGYGGRLQFGDARLADAARAGLVPPGTTGAQFSRMPPEVQQRVENWHFADIDQQAARMGLDRFIGQQVGGIPITQDAIRSMAHLGGIGGAQKFLTSGGQHNPADSNGTSLADYARMHGGASAPGSGAPTAPGPGAGIGALPQYSGPPLADLYAAVTNPWLSAEERGVAASMLERAMQASDPMHQMQMQQAQLGLQKAQMEIAQMGQPQPVEGKAVGGALVNPYTGEVIYQGETDPKMPTSVQEYEYYRQQALAAGQEPMPYEQFSVEKARAGATNVSVNTAGEVDRYLYGSDAGLPAGWRLDRQTGEASMIPGGPSALEAGQAEAKGENKDRQSNLKLGTTLESLNLNIAEIENGGLPVTGAIGDFRRTGIGRALTGNSAVDFGNRTAQITDSAAFSEIQNMRDNSPTGGAVGQLTDDERRAIGNSVTALNNSTSAAEYLRAAKAYRDLALNLAYGEGRWTLNEDGTIAVGTAGGASAPPEGIDPQDWEFMTPEERALFQ